MMNFSFSRRYTWKYTCEQLIDLGPLRKTKPFGGVWLLMRDTYSWNRVGIHLRLMFLSKLVSTPGGELAL